MSRVRVKRGPNVLARQMGEDLVLLNLDTNRFFELNRTAARFWDLLADGAELQTIEDAMVTEFDVDRSELSAELSSLVEAMRVERLLTVAMPGERKLTVASIHPGADSQASDRAPSLSLRKWFRRGFNRTPPTNTEGTP